MAKTPGNFENKQTNSLSNIADDIPQWMLAQEILVKTKNELILEAIDLVHIEIDEKRLEINGNTVKLPDKSSEIEMDMLIISNLLEKEDEISKQYSEFIKKIENGEEEKPELIERMDELKKFLMAISSIHLLMGFVKVIDSWVLDFAETMKINNTAMIIAETAKRNVERIDILEFVIKSKNFLKSEALSDEEIDIVKKALQLCR